MYIQYNVTLESKDESHPWRKSLFIESRSVMLSVFVHFPLALMGNSTGYVWQAYILQGQKYEQQRKDC